MLISPRSKRGLPDTGALMRLQWRKKAPALPKSDGVRINADQRAAVETPRAFNYERRGGREYPLSSDTGDACPNRCDN